MIVVAVVVIRGIIIVIAMVVAGVGIVSISAFFGCVATIFAGAQCIHWTTENKTGKTRVSLDFRVIDGTMFGKLKCGSEQTGGWRDVYREKEGYYTHCELVDDQWIRTEELPQPDYRVGYPWTVKEWGKSSD